MDSFTSFRGRELYDFYFAAIKSSKSIGWFDRTFSPYDILTMSDVIVLVVNSDTELKNLRHKTLCDFLLD